MGGFFKFLYGLTLPIRFPVGVVSLHVVAPLLVGLNTLVVLSIENFRKAYQFDTRQVDPDFLGLLAFSNSAFRGLVKFSTDPLASKIAEYGNDNMRRYLKLPEDGQYKLCNSEFESASQLNKSGIDIASSSVKAPEKLALNSNQQNKAQPTISRKKGDPSSSPRNPAKAEIPGSAKELGTPVSAEKSGATRS